MHFKYLLVVLVAFALPLKVRTQSCYVYLCENGWSKFVESPEAQFCFKAILGSAPVNLNDGQNICHQNTAELASIHSIAEQNFVANLANPNANGTNTWWLGLRLQWSDGNFIQGNPLPKLTSTWWTDETAVDFGNAHPWFTNEPNGAVAVSGVFYDANEGYYWDDILPTATNYANAIFGAVCKYDNVSYCSSAYWAIAGGASEYNGGCYQVLPAQTGGYNQAQAEATCVAIGGHLTSVHSEGENEFIRGLIFAVEQAASYQVNVAANYHYWIGLQLIRAVPTNKLVTDATWTDGTPAVYGVPVPWYTSGASGGLQPDGPLGQGLTGAVQLVDIYGDRWNDHTPATQSNGVICKKPATAYSGTIA